MADPLKFPATALVRTNSTPADRRKRFLLFLAWLLLVAWLLATHVVWRDEVRALTLALSGADIAQLLRNIHGEGHPALWYLILRFAHDLFPSPLILPIAGAAIGIAAMALFAIAAPLRSFVVALVLFSLFGAFEFVVVARNYGISALVMFALAALYPRIKDSPWLGVILALLCNTNVPSCILAAAFLLLRFLEMLAQPERSHVRSWLTLALNAGLAAAGALLCFLTVYPPLNQGAVSPNFQAIGAGQILAALVDGTNGFSNLLLNLRGPLPAILLWLSCLAFVRSPGALFCALAALLGLKLFFFFVYPSAYRHEALFVVFLLSLLWIVARGGGGSWKAGPWTHWIETTGAVALVALLLVQVLDLAKPLYLQARGVPYSRSADVARLLEQPALSNSVVMADPDTMLEPLPYYVGNPLWFLREGGFARLFLRTRKDRQEISLDTILADASRVHRLSGRPVVILIHDPVEIGERARPGRRVTMYSDSTIVSPASAARFRQLTRPLASLRPAITDEAYDVYLYPR